MKNIAITYKDGDIYPFFESSPCFLVVAADGKLVAEKTECPVEALPADISFFAAKNISAVICGEITETSYTALRAPGITVVRGQSGSAEAAAMFYLNGDLKDNPPGKVCRHAPHGICNSESCSGCQ